MSYRPRGALARALFEKVHNDQFLEEFDMALWYKMEKQLPARFQAKFVSFEQPDQVTMQWLDQAKAMSANMWLQIWHIFARFFLTMFSMTQTDVNGLLQRGSMFILSEDQFITLLTESGFKGHGLGGGATEEVEILDIGAGDGEITERLHLSVRRMLADINGDQHHQTVSVYVTETSWIMRKRLDKYENFSVIEVDSVRQLSNLNLISCLNVLDRCADPHQMLRDIHNMLSPHGRAIFALVLPYSHYVETNTSHMPVHPLLPHWPNRNIVGGCGEETGRQSDSCSAEQAPASNRRPSFDEETRIFFEQLELTGFKVEAWTKAPYLCEGDIRQSFYWLIDIVVVVSKNNVDWVSNE